MPVNNIDLGRVYTVGEQIKGMKTRNALNDMTLQRNQQVNALLPQAAGGDEAAMKELAGIDPTTARQLGALNDEQRARARQKVEFLAGLLLGVETAPTEQRQTAWTQAIQTAQAQGFDTSKVPPQYDPKYARMLGSQFVSIDNLLSGGKGFTLSPGARRYDAEGNLIAKAPMSPRQMGTGKGNSLTAGQTANNSEIDTARRRIDELASSLEPGVTLEDELFRRMSVKDPRSGRLTADYNSFWGRTAWLAAQAKTGGDTDQDRYSRYVMGQAAAPNPIRQEPTNTETPETSGNVENSGWQLPWWLGGAGEDEAAGPDAPWAAVYNGVKGYSNDGQNWYDENGKRLEW